MTLITRQTINLAAIVIHRDDWMYNLFYETENGFETKLDEESWEEVLNGI